MGKPSPLEAFVNTVRLMGQQRRALSGAFEVSKDWLMLLDDLEMMMTERVIVGLRMKWVRRVAVPILHAHRAITDGTKPPKERAATALEIMKQCTDARLRGECEAWITEEFGGAA